MNRIDFVTRLFTGAPQHEVFDRMAGIFPVATMTASPEPRPFPEGESIALPESFRYLGSERSVAGFLAETETAALLVVKDGTLRLEDYRLTGGRDVNWMSMSVAKSFVSAAIGIAVGDGAIESIEEPVTDYLPSLAGSAYDGVRIKDILQMSSGARWNEDYSDPESDINRFAAIFARGGAFGPFTATLKREREPGVFNLYNSTDTQVLGMLLVAATGRPIRDFMEERLWHPLGMESPAHWIVDQDRMEMAFGGLNATARDYAKLGELYRNGGNWHGRQIVPAEWVQASVTPDAPHLRPGVRDSSDSAFGYGYQWWVMEGDEGEYSAIGVYNQFIYVNPARATVIVKLSASRNYGQTNDETSYREAETIEMFRAIADAVD